MPVALYGLPLLIIGIAPSRSLSCHSDRKPNSNITQVIVVVFLRGWVVVDYFINEEWFFHTLDSMYEGFGFYNIYRFSGMMPVFWTL
ncbi:hypothetical protein AFLA_014189 [Aspergillus flavus NRRL3357]|nr:hypothetical protein AFLA_014189 [Aspergillus flavus NRRL3357]